MKKTGIKNIKIPNHKFQNPPEVSGPNSKIQFTNSSGGFGTKSQISNLKFQIFKFLLKLRNQATFLHIRLFYCNSQFKTVNPFLLYSPLSFFPVPLHQN